MQIERRGKPLSALIFRQNARIFSQALLYKAKQAKMQKSAKKMKIF